MTLEPGPRLRCCFCGVTPRRSEYIEMTLKVHGSPARQGFGAHVECLEGRLARGFTLEIDPEFDEGEAG